MSGSANESKKPESNSDSSAAGTDFFLETFFRMAMILSLLSIRSLGANREKPVVLLQQFLDQHVANQAIARAGEVHIVALAQARLYPFANRSRTAHSAPPVPECAAVFECDLTLDVDHIIQVRERQTAGPIPQIGRASCRERG